MSCHFACLHLIFKDGPSRVHRVQMTHNCDIVNKGYSIQQRPHTTSWNLWSHYQRTTSNLMLTRCSRKRLWLIILKASETQPNQQGCTLPLVPGVSHQLGQLKLFLAEILVRSQTNNFIQVFLQLSHCYLGTLPINGVANWLVII